MIGSYPYRWSQFFGQEVLNFGLGTFKFVPGSCGITTLAGSSVSVSSFILCVLEVPFPQAEE